MRTHWTGHKDCLRLESTRRAAVAALLAKPGMVAVLEKCEAVVALHERLPTAGSLYSLVWYWYHNSADLTDAERALWDEWARLECPRFRFLSD